MGRRSPGPFKFHGNPSKRSLADYIGLAGVSQNRQQHRRDTLAAGVIDEAFELALHGTRAVRSQPVGEIGGSRRDDCACTDHGAGERSSRRASPAIVTSRIHQFSC